VCLEYITHFMRECYGIVRWIKYKIPARLHTINDIGLDWENGILVPRCNPRLYYYITDDEIVTHTNLTYAICNRMPICRATNECMLYAHTMGVNVSDTTYIDRANEFGEKLKQIVVFP
jgi:hypothetical protein